MLSELAPVMTTPLSLIPSTIFYQSSDPRDAGSGADRTNWFRLHFCTADRVVAFLKNDSSLL
jgi:hypothetical protein